MMFNVQFNAHLLPSAAVKMKYFMQLKKVFGLRFVGPLRNHEIALHCTNSGVEIIMFTQHALPFHSHSKVFAKFDHRLH